MSRETVRGINGLAARLGLHRNTVGKWVRSGKLDRAMVVSFGRCYVFDVEMVYSIMGKLES